MTLTQTKAFKAFELLPESSQNLVYQLIVTLIPDDIATPDDLAAHAAAIAEFERGETTDFDDIDWD